MNDPSELWASGALDDWKALMSSYDTRIGEHKVSDHERWFRDCLPNLLVTQQGCLSKEQFYQTCGMEARTREIQTIPSGIRCETRSKSSCCSIQRGI
eukprot:jgi/Picre1/27566/NNA_000532.t2